MNSQPLVSILINCYNGEEFVKQAIESAYSQTYQNWEIIFWDNASTDNTADIAKSYTDGKLRYFRGEETVPLYSARNFAIKHAKGEFLAFLDSDDLWEPEKLEKQIPLFENSEVGLVFADVFFFRDGKNVKQLYKGRPFYTGKIFDKLMTDYFLSLCSVVVRMKCLQEQPEIFDDRFQIIGDADLFRRIAYKGWKFEMVNAPLAKWRIHGNNLTFKESGKIISENEQLLTKFSELYPGFSDQFKDEIFQLRSNIAREEAKSLIGQSDNGSARDVISPFIKDKKSLIVYCMTLIPNKLSNWLIRNYYRDSR